MRALSIDGAGLISSRLIDALVDRGDSFILLNNLSTGRLENIEHLQQRDDVEFVLGAIARDEIRRHVLEDQRR